MSLQIPQSLGHSVILSPFTHTDVAARYHCLHTIAFAYALYHNIILCRLAIIHPKTTRTARYVPIQKSFILEATTPYRSGQN